MRKLIAILAMAITLGTMAFASTGAGAVDTFSWGTPGQTTVSVNAFAPNQWAPAGTYAINPSESLVLIGQMTNWATYDGYNVTNGTAVAAIVNGVILAPGSFLVAMLPPGAILAALVPYQLGTYTQAETFDY